MKFATIDGTGAVTGFYDDSGTVPQGAVQLTDQQWLDWVANQQTRRWINRSLTTVAPPSPSPGTVLAQKLATGIALSSTGTPAINGTYAYDTQTQTDLSGIAATIGLLGTFPDGSTSGYQYPQLGGQSVTTFPSIAAFKAFYGAYAKLLQQLRAQGAVLLAGGTPTWSSQSVTIA